VSGCGRRTGGPWSTAMAHKALPSAAAAAPPTTVEGALTIMSLPQHRDHPTGKNPTAIANTTRQDPRRGQLPLSLNGPDRVDRPISPFR
jgi:hypothetical protein